MFFVPLMKNRISLLKMGLYNSFSGQVFKAAPALTLNNTSVIDERFILAQINGSIRTGLFF